MPHTFFPLPEAAGVYSLCTSDEQIKLNEENTMAERRIPTREEVLSYLHQRRNWGRWGQDDQVGAINPDHPGQARQGSLARPDGP